MKKYQLSRSTKKLLIVFLVLAFIGAMLELGEAREKKRQEEAVQEELARQEEAERLRQEELRLQEIQLEIQREKEAPFYERAYEQGEWEAVISNRDINDIGNEPTVSMNNLVLAIYEEAWITDDERIPRRFHAFYLFSNGWIYTATEYFQQTYHDPEEICYVLTFDDEMWKHLSDWKCLGRISCEEMAFIKVNMWQANTKEYEYFQSMSAFIPAPESEEGHGSDILSETSMTFREDDGTILKLPTFEGMAYIVLDGECYEYWVMTKEGVRYTQDKYIHNVMEDVIGSDPFMRWQE